MYALPSIFCIARFWPPAGRRRVRGRRNTASAARRAGRDIRRNERSLSFDSKSLPDIRRETDVRWFRYSRRTRRFPYNCIWCSEVRIWNRSSAFSFTNGNVRFLLYGFTARFGSAGYGSRRSGRRFWRRRCWRNPRRSAGRPSPYTRRSAPHRTLRTRRRDRPFPRRRTKWR